MNWCEVVKAGFARGWIRMAPPAPVAVHMCDCGRPAAVKRGTEWLCARCNALERDLSEVIAAPPIPINKGGRPSVSGLSLKALGRTEYERRRRELIRNGTIKTSPRKVEPHTTD